MPRRARRDIFADAKVILCRWHSDIIFAVYTREANITRQRRIAFCVVNQKTLPSKSYFFAVIVKSKYKESVLTSQLLRSGTSIGANIHEAQYAQGKKDFISKLEIAQKECFETRNQHINHCKLNAVQSEEC